MMYLIAASLLLNIVLLILWLRACPMWNKADIELKHLEWQDRMRKQQLTRSELDRLLSDPNSGYHFTLLDTEF